jgi:hypothetical protein
MDKIVDHLFILEVMVEDFQETTLILELMKTVLMLLKRSEKKDWKQNNQPNLTFNEQKIQKIERKSKI